MLLDPRGPRFAAAVTTLVLVAVLVTGSGWLALARRRCSRSPRPTRAAARTA